MARSKNELKLTEAWLKIYNKHCNPIWATEELEWLVLEKHYSEFANLDLADQWEIRNMLGAFSKLYK